jgi:hypothetical protein
LVSATATLTHGTVAANHVGAAGNGIGAVDGQDGGVVEGPSGDLTLRSTIVASNDDDNCGGAITDGGHNLDFPTADASCPADVHADPLLGPVQDNGGLSPTMMLGAGSAAIDQAGTGGFCPAEDQRDVTRPKGAACDIGALEKSAPSATTGNASAITANSASVGGSVNPGEVPTSYRFQYGKTTAYGSQTASVSAGSGAAAVAALATLTGLDPITTYHYRLIATSPDGNATGADRTFTTTQGPFPGVSILTKKAKLDKKRRAKIKLSCPAIFVVKDTCSGTLTLTAKVKKNGKKRTLKLGKKAFTIAAGTTKTVKVKISKKGAKLVARKGKLKAKAKASATDARGGKPVVKTGKVTLKPRKKKGKH